MKTINYSTAEFEKEYTYSEDDLGAVWTKEETTFRVWAPTAEAVSVNLYETGNAKAEDLIEQLPMEKDVCGTWVVKKQGDLHKTYYTYEVSIGGEINEACDPYARTTGANGVRAMVIDLASTNPDAWEIDSDPHADNTITDAIIYELHVRDLSVDETSGIQNKGKFLGIAEAGTKNAAGHATGLDHMKELGITHLHLLPVYDYGSVDETRLEEPQFNWGYDPVNYNVPEGSYSTDPFHGEVRVREMKQMIQTLHQNGISVIMDVVYNHVYDAEQFCFNKIVPGYFSRIDENGTYSDGSCCGNDTASERSMVKKYIVDSVCYWADEYHIDGFRFDLVGLLDTETINAIVESVHKKHPNVIFYGEGWTMPTGITKTGYKMATQLNSKETPEFAYFSDTLRDGLKGRVFFADSIGYVTGADDATDVIKSCLLGLPDWCAKPAQTINYASCHDNYTLMDKIALSIPEASREEWIRCNNLAAAIYMLAQGVPFIHAGEELLRSKVDEQGAYVENSYASSDYVNSFKWDVLEQEEYQKVFAYYKGLIEVRKKYASLRYMTAEEVNQHVYIEKGQEANVIVVKISDSEKQEELMLAFNPNKDAVKVTLPEGEWTICVDGEKAGVWSLRTVNDKEVEVAPISAMVLVRA
ncbi:MAG: type I pullulanase [Roseburia sp.]|nr:type I pullulanase [Roseburia sp.]